jgi:hypothetical protein
MSAYTHRKGQRGKVYRLRTGYDLSQTTQRIVRLARPEAATVEITNVPFDPKAPSDLLWAVAAGQLDEIGTYSVEVEIQEQFGANVLRCDIEITIEVTEIGATI